jgi:cytochrome P450
MQEDPSITPSEPNGSGLADALGATLCPAGFPVISAEMLRNPKALSVLRDAGVTQVSLGGGENGWMATRYATASEVLVKTGLRGEHPMAWSMRTAAEEEVCDEEQLFFLPTDEHTRLRRMISRQLTHRRVAGLTERIQREADHLLDSIPHSEPVDLVQSFCRPFPVAVLCELLDIPAPERRYIRNYVYGWVAEYGEASLVTKSAGIELADYLKTLIAARREAPGDDLITAMLRTGESDSLAEDVLSAIRLLLVAGHRPVTRLLTEGIEILLERREEWERIKQDPERLSQVIEELLRYVTPTTLSSRYASEDTVVEDVPLGPGTGIHCALAGVNRDPEKFEHPNTFDPDRTANHHLAFGLGHKHCLGAALARAEIHIALSTLATRFPHAVLTEKLPDESGRRQLPVVLAPDLPTCPVPH